MPVFEIILDHNASDHQDQMTRAAKALQAWAAQHGITKLIREQQMLRPGVFHVKFFPDGRVQRPAVVGDRLSLSHAGRAR